MSSNEENLEIFSSKYTPKLLEIAEKNVIEHTGIVFNYLESYDQKWLIASECIHLSEIPLPEFSPVVMPASKAFEGFIKKLLVDIGLFDIEHFKTKNANLGALHDYKNPNRKLICEREKHADTFLKRIGVDLDRYRNFMMHSDDSEVTKIETANEAEKTLKGIYLELKELYEYFNKYWKISI